ncbi:MAG TPA: hypothetical protein PLL30_14175 [Candidatus Krumholzibacteria bacterium]|nr:hypothetical protein [Candidatus Krumholzibacteria bacterium]HPD72913.1 hypothetical protein [Candidatus Krumholzibacteria bacterium]HRY41712.1 hypothetical protein [Candidatus Krumholzibacteria bacterium]
MLAAALLSLVLGVTTPADLVRTYVRYVLAGDDVAAAGCWREADLVSSRRLGIRYVDQPLKIDGDSPLWRAVGALRDGAATWAVSSPAPVTDGSAVVELSLQSGGQEIRHPYRVVREGERAWRLASPVMLEMASLPADTGTYVVARGRTVEIAVLDSCVAAMTKQLEFPPSRLGEIKRVKLGYLAMSADEVEQLVGAPTVGVANLQQDVVVTSHPCHAHELAHLVVNAWLGEMPLFTLPLLQEGIATDLGGRWGRHPRVLDRVGRTSLADRIVSLDDMLVRADFQALSADLTYPAAAVFVGYVRERFGAAGLRAAYLACSGTATKVSSWSREEVKALLTDALDVDFDDVARGLSAYISTAVDPEVRPSGAVSPHARRVATDSLTAAIDFESSGTVFWIRAEGGDARGAVLFGGADDTIARNDLFAEHFPERPFRGETIGVLFSPDEVKVYDYRLQMLVGLHSQGFWPTATFAREQGRALRFTVSPDLGLDGGLPMSLVP